MLFFNSYIIYAYLFITSFFCALKPFGWLSDMLTAMMSSNCCDDIMNIKKILNCEVKEYFDDPLVSTLGWRMLT